MTLTINEVAERYGVTPATVRQWARAGELISFSVSRTPGSKKRRLRFTQEALAIFESSRQVSPALPTRKRKQRRTDVIEFYASR